MKYFVELASRTFEVEVDADGVHLDGQAVAASLDSNDGSRLFHLMVDGRSHTLIARPREERGEWEIELRGHRHQVMALDERRRAIRKIAGAAATAQGPLAMRAPMPGLIIAVEVGPDDVVRQGQGLVVIEAMKMENELKSPVAGRVAEVKARPGQAVDKGDTLLVIEPEAAEHGRAPRDRITITRGSG
jgi:pyruvate carboxylase subunit B